MPMTVNRSKSKPEVEFQYGGRLFAETGSSNISAVEKKQNSTKLYQTVDSKSRYNNLLQTTWVRGSSSKN